MDRPEVMKRVLAGALALLALAVLGWSIKSSAIPEKPPVISAGETPRTSDDPEKFGPEHQAH